MTFYAFILILLSVLSHALWNFLCKSGEPCARLFLMLSITVMAVTLPIALSTGLLWGALPREVFLFAFLGGTSGMIANLNIARVYALTDMSYSYPLIRALPVIFTMAFTAAFGLGKSLSWLAVLGMLIICSGCVVMALGASFSATSGIVKLSTPWREVFRGGLKHIIIAALGITGYTIFDAYGIKNITVAAANSGVNSVCVACTYSFLRETFLGAQLFLFILARPTLRAELQPKYFLNWRPYFAGVNCVLAYVMVLLATREVTNVSFVQAFRQLSLPIGMAMGIIFLHEKFTWNKAVAIVLILSGLVISVFR